MTHRTIRLILLLAVAATAFAALAAPGFARHGEGEDEHVHGTVASFSDGVLTIRQSGGDKVSGKVTRRTEIECAHRSNRSRARTAVAARHGGDDDNGDDHRHGRDDAREHHAREHHARDRCGTRQLTADRAVRDAELSSTSSGLVFREIELVR
jgi:hypothetical protein